MQHESMKRDKIPVINDFPDGLNGIWLHGSIKKDNLHKITRLQKRATTVNYDEIMVSRQLVREN